MSPEVEAYLSLIAEVAVATVALSGITMVLIFSRIQLTEPKMGHIVAQLSIAFAVVVFALFPLMAINMPFVDEHLWRISSGCYLTLILTLQAMRLLKNSPLPNVSGYMNIPTTIPGVTAVILLTANIWLGEAWPHVLQLFIALVFSLALFLMFIYASISELLNEQDRPT